MMMEINTIMEIIQKSFHKERIICVYDNECEDSFYCGVIVGIDDEFILMRMFSPSGNYNGLIVICISNIYRVVEKGDYILKMEKLASKVDNSNFCTFQNSDDVIESIFDYARKSNVIISISLCNSGYNNVVGFVQHFNKSACVIKQIDSLGEFDGISYISCEMITQITCESLEEDIVTKFYRIGER